jgi:hypothetical protein
VSLADAGWEVLPWDRRVADWAAAGLVAARVVVTDPAERARWLRHGGTWFVGVDALPNAPDGSVGGVALTGPWEDAVRWEGDWHRAQLSVVWPGYPGRDAGESEAAHRFRCERDAAHLDGLLGEGEGKRRHLREPHAFVLGLPLTVMTEGQAPFVVWEGSHHVIGRAFAAAFAGVAPEGWGDVDVTEVYQAARREVFETCRRVVVTAGPGEAILCHRRAIHGTAAWSGGETGPRMVAWFRPVLTDVAAWLG